MRFTAAIATALIALGSPLATAPALAEARRASLIVDANSGAVLHADEADTPRYPASLTKMMTLYVVFDQIGRGKLGLATRIPISAAAAATAPSKLGLDVGETISVEDAVKALITKSANDIAVALAEHVAGSERHFAQMMTDRARQIGMSRTTFRNASGLPDDAQVTTARDMITLALRLQDDFPRLYTLFATRRFAFNGNTYRNHNTLLFNFQGTEGIKTGYTRVSGFNLVASVRRDGRHVVGAIFGGTSASARDVRMRALLQVALRKAATVKTRKPILVARAAPQPRLAERRRLTPAPVLPERPTERPASRPAAQADTGRGRALALAPTPTPTPTPTPPPERSREPAPQRAPAMPAPMPDIAVARVRPVDVLAARRAAAPGSRPNETVIAKSTGSDRVTGSELRPAGVATPRAQAPMPAYQPAMPPPAQSAVQPAFPPAVLQSAALPASSEPPHRAVAAAREFATMPVSPTPVSPTPGVGQPPSTLQAQAAALEGRRPGPPTADTRRFTAPSALGLRPGFPTAPTPGPRVPATPDGPYQIQIGAFASTGEAERRLADVQAQAGSLLAIYRPVATPIDAGGKRLYRARYAGFDAAAAAHTCTALRRQQVDCFVAKATP